MMNIELNKSFKMLFIGGGNIMEDIPYWPPEKVTIKVKDEECTEKVLKIPKVHYGVPKGVFRIYTDY